MQTYNNTYHLGTFRSHSLGTMSTEQVSKEAAARSKRVKTLICYVCQKEYNIKKIQGHLKTCKAKWIHA